MKCGLCGHEAKRLGGSADGVDLCHGCIDGFDCEGDGQPVLGRNDDSGRSCYERWTVYKERPPVGERTATTESIDDPPEIEAAYMVGDVLLSVWIDGVEFARAPTPAPSEPLCVTCGEPIKVCIDPEGCSAFYHVGRVDE